MQYNTAMFLKALIYLAFSATALSAQTFLNYPGGMDNKPLSPLKGPVHTVLSTEQRGEKVFSNTAEVYDAKGRMTESLDSNAGIEIHSGTLVRLGGKAAYLYGADERLSRVNQFYSDGTFSGYELYKYDKMGRLIEISLFDAQAKSRGWERYSYATDRKEVEMTWLFVSPGMRLDVPPMRSLLTYDDGNRWTSRTMFLSSKDTVKFQYDLSGNLVKEATSGYGHNYTYKFDKYGNWIERINSYYQDNEPNKAGEWMHEFRVITYYSDSEAQK
jgi:hypothetical protein